MDLDLWSIQMALVTLPTDHVEIVNIWSITIWNILLMHVINYKLLVLVISVWWAESIQHVYSCT